MKYRLEGTTIESIGTHVRITLGNGRTETTECERPTNIVVAEMLARMQGYWPNDPQLQACSRAAEEARKHVA